LNVVPQRLEVMIGIQMMPDVALGPQAVCSATSLSFFQPEKKI